MPRISKRIKVKNDRFNCTVMEVKMIEGYGTTIDCILVDGKIKKDDQIVLLGFKGPIVTKVKAILTPHPMKEMRYTGGAIGIPNSAVCVLFLANRVSDVPVW